MKKEFRIKKSEEIEALLKLKNVTGGKNFVIYKKENHEISHFRYALAVPKKFGDAVYRNQMKRRVRSIIREGNLRNDVEFFVVVKAKANVLSFDEIKNELTYLIKKAKLLEETNEQTV